MKKKGYLTEPHGPGHLAKGLLRNWTPEARAVGAVKSSRATAWKKTKPVINDPWGRKESK